MTLTTRTTTKFGCLCPTSHPQHGRYNGTQYRRNQARLLQCHAAMVCQPLLSMYKHRTTWSASPASVHVKLMLN